MVVVDEDDHWVWSAGRARAVFSSREGGVSDAPFDSLNVGLHVGDEPACVLDNRRRAAALVGLEPAQVAGVTQVHGADVWVDLRGGAELPGDVRWDGGDASPIEADALVTTRSGVALAVAVADCMPIAIAWGDAIAAIHAGWRSLDGGVIEATLAMLRRAAGSAVALANVGPFAVIGPALGPCCMEVGEEVAARFGSASIIRRDGAPRPSLDARAEATRRLERVGARVEHVEVCTRCDPRLFSHRGEAGRTGRQSLLVRRV